MPENSTFIDPTLQSPPPPASQTPTAHDVLDNPVPAPDTTASPTADPGPSDPGSKSKRPKARKPMPPGSAADFRRKEANRLAAERSRMRASEKAKGIEYNVKKMAEENARLCIEIEALEQALKKAGHGLANDTEGTDDNHGIGAGTDGQIGAGSGEGEEDHSRGLLEALMMSGGMDGLDSYDGISIVPAESEPVAVEPRLEEETSEEVTTAPSTAVVDIEPAATPSTASAAHALSSSSDPTPAALPATAYSPAQTNQNPSSTSAGGKEVKPFVPVDLSSGNTSFTYSPLEAITSVCSAVAVSLNAEMEKSLRDDVASSRAGIVHLEKEMTRLKGILSQVNDRGDGETDQALDSNDQEPYSTPAPLPPSILDPLPAIRQAISNVQAELAMVDARLPRAQEDVAVLRKTKIVEESRLAAVVRRYLQAEDGYPAAATAANDGQPPAKRVRTEQDAKYQIDKKLHIQEVKENVKGLKGYLGWLVWGNGSGKEALGDNTIYSTPAIARRKRGRPPKSSLHAKQSHSMLYPTHASPSTSGTSSSANPSTGRHSASSSLNSTPTRPTRTRKTGSGAANAAQGPGPSGLRHGVVATSSHAQDSREPSTGVEDASRHPETGASHDEQLGMEAEDEDQAHAQAQAQAIVKHLRATLASARNVEGQDATEHDHTLAEHGNPVAAETIAAAIQNAKQQSIPSAATDVESDSALGRSGLVSSGPLPNHTDTAAGLSNSAPSHPHDTSPFDLTGDTSAQYIFDQLKENSDVFSDLIRADGTSHAHLIHPDEEAGLHDYNDEYGDEEDLSPPGSQMFREGGEGEVIGEGEGEGAGTGIDGQPRQGRGRGSKRIDGIKCNAEDPLDLEVHDQLRQGPPGSCEICARTDTTVWRRLRIGGEDFRACNACGLYHKKFGVIRPNSMWGDSEAIRKRRPAKGPDEDKRRIKRARHLVDGNGNGNGIGNSGLMSNSVQSSEEALDSSFVHPALDPSLSLGSGSISTSTSAAAPVIGVGFAHMHGHGHGHDLMDGRSTPWFGDHHQDRVQDDLKDSISHSASNSASACASTSTSRRTNQMGMGKTVAGQVLRAAETAAAVAEGTGVEEFDPRGLVDEETRRRMDEVAARHGHGHEHGHGHGEGEGGMADGLGHNHDQYNLQQPFSSALEGAEGTGQVDVDVHVDANVNANGDGDADADADPLNMGLGSEELMRVLGQMQ